MKIKRVEQFKSKYLDIPSFEIGTGDWITIIFPSHFLSDEILIRKKYVQTFLDENTLDVRPWNKMNFSSGQNYDDGIIELISQNMNKKQFVLIGPISDREKYYNFLDVNRAKFGIIEFFHPCNYDVHFEGIRKIIDLSEKNRFDGKNTILKE